jgi:hypothetical protein
VAAAARTRAGHPRARAFGKNFGTTLGDTWAGSASRRPRTSSTLVELRHDGKFATKSGGCDESRVFLEAYKSRSRSSTAAEVTAPVGGPPTNGGTAPMLFFGRLKRRCAG